MDVSLKIPGPFAKVSLPIVGWISECTKESVVSDLVAGFTVFVFLVPQGMAYALLAGMPPIYGLYSAIVPSYMYALLGTSKQLSIGPMAITSLLLSLSIENYGFPQQSPEYIVLVMNLSLVVGVVVLLIGLLRMGSLVNLISESVLSGFLTASSVVILVNQLKYILGIAVPHYDYIHQTVQYLVFNVTQTNFAALCIGVLTSAALYATKQWAAAESARRTPSDSICLQVLRHCAAMSNLIAIIVGPLVSYFLLSQGFQLEIVGTVPSGLKLPGFQFVGIRTLMGFLPSALALAFVSFAGNWAVATKYATKHNYQVDATQELIATGLATTVGVFFNSFAVSGGLARSAVNAESGARTQLSSVVAATLMIFAVQFCTGMFYYIPMSTLGAVIVVSVLSMMDFAAMQTAYHTHTKDCLVMVITFLVTLFVGVVCGLFVGIGISVIVILCTVAYPYIHILGQMPPVHDGHSDESGDHFREIARFEKAEKHPGVLIMRMEATIFFANCGYFKETVLHEVNSTPLASGEVNCYSKVHAVIIDASCWTDLDLPSTKALLDLRDRLHKQHVMLLVAGAMGQVHEKLSTTHFAGHFCYHSIKKALRSAKAMQKFELAEVVDRAELAQRDEREQELLPLLHTSMDANSRNALLAESEGGSGVKMTGYGSIVDNTDNI